MGAREAKQKTQKASKPSSPYEKYCELIDNSKLHLWIESKRKKKAVDASTALIVYFIAAYYSTIIFLVTLLSPEVTVNRYIPELKFLASKTN